VGGAIAFVAIIVLISAIFVIPKMKSTIHGGVRTESLEANIDASRNPEVETASEQTGAPLH